MRGAMLFCSKYEYNSDDDAKWIMVIEGPIGLAKIGHLLYFCFSVTLPPHFIGETMSFFLFLDYLNTLP
jgi:hypothetical protein